MSILRKSSRFSQNLVVRTKSLIGVNKMKDKITPVQYLKAISNPFDYQFLPSSFFEYYENNIQIYVCGLRKFKVLDLNDFNPSKELAEDEIIVSEKLINELSLIGDHLVLVLLINKNHQKDVVCEARKRECQFFQITNIKFLMINQISLIIIIQKCFRLNKLNKQKNTIVQIHLI